jgi:hypothetical protein
MNARHEAARILQHVGVVAKIRLILSRRFETGGALENDKTRLQRFGNFPRYLPSLPNFLGGLKSADVLLG